MDWAVVVPVKRLTAAKSRLGDRSAEERAALALAFATDAVRAALRVPGVVTVVVVTADPSVSAAMTDLGVEIVTDAAEPDLNTALTTGATTVREQRPTLGLAALVADLPALVAEDLGLALSRAATLDGAFVADRSGDGTSLVTAAAGRPLVALFGPGSAARHAAAGLQPVSDPVESLRCDVDSEEDLLVALRLGVGPATARALEATPGLTERW